MILIPSSSRPIVPKPTKRKASRKPDHEGPAPATNEPISQAITVAVASLFAGGTLINPNEYNEYASTLAISFARPTPLSLAFAGTAIGVILYLIWTNLIVTAWSNATNLTDGLDGLAAGVSIFVFGAYTFIAYFCVWRENVK